MLIRVPQCLKNEQQYQSLSMEGVTVMEYRTARENRQMEVLFSEHALAFVLEGKKILHTTAATHTVEPGQALFIRRGCYALSETFTDRNVYSSIVFFFTEQLVKQFVTEFPALMKVPGTAEAPDFTIFSAGTRLLEAARSVLPCFTDDRTLLPHLLPLKLKELLLLIMQEDRDYAIRHLFVSLYAEKKQTLQSLVNEHFLKNLSLEEWAMLSGRSLSTFKRDFVACFGAPPHQWLLQKKLEHAHFLLLHSDLTVSEIAYAIGLESVSHFSKIFARKYGYTPGNCRAETVTD